MSPSLKRRLAGLSKYLLLPLAVPLLALLLLGYWLLATNAGSDWLLRRLAGAAPVPVTVEKIDGTLARGVALSRLEITTDTTRVTVDSAGGQWQLLSLLGGQLQLDRLTASGITVEQTAQAPEDDGPSPWPSLTTPIPVAVKALEVKEVQLRQLDGTVVDLGQLVFAGLFSPGNHHIQRLEYRRPGLSTSLSGRLSGRFPYRHKLNVQWQFQPPEGWNALVGEGSLSGDIKAAELRHQLTAPSRVTSTGTLHLSAKSRHMAVSTGDIRIDVSSQWQSLALQWRDLIVESAGSLGIAGTVDDYRLDLSLEAAAADPGRADTGLLLAVTPDSDTPPAAADNGSDDRAKILLPARLAATAAGDSAGLTRIDASLATATGEADISGAAGWADIPSWDLAANIRNLNLAPFLDGYPLTLSGPLNTTGDLDKGDIRATVDARGLTGTLGDHTFDGNLVGRYSADQLQLEQLQLAIAANRLEASGTLGPVSEFRWQLQAPDLAALNLGMAGQLDSEGSFTGSLKLPLITAAIEGRQLRFGQWRADQLTVAATADTGARLTIDGDIRGLAGPDLPTAAVTLSARGTLADHTLQIAAETVDMNGSLGAAGGYSERQWSGLITELSASTPFAGDWQLTESARLTVAPQIQRLEALCLQSGGSICLSASRSTTGLEASGTLDSVDLALLKPWLPAATTLEGELDGTVDVKGTFNADDSDHRYSGIFRVETRDAILVYGGTEGKPLRQSLNLSASGDLDRDALTIDAGLAVDDTATASLRLRTGLTDADAPLAGDLHVDMPSLQWLEAITAELGDPDGSLDGTFVLAGTRGAPRVDGELQLRGFTADLPAAGIHLDRGDVTARVSADQRWQLDGEVALNNGLAAVTGNGTIADLLAGNAELAIRGDNLALVDLPDMRIDVSPDVRVARRESKWRVDGSLAIPSADIVLRPLPEGAVTTSADEEIDPPLARRQDAPNLTVDLAVKLGDDVQIEGYGLDTKLTGNLRLQRKATGLLTARGRIDLRDGTFEGYGQELTITQGQLLFQGNIENPGLNIVAVRETPTADVGLRIGGFLKQIESEVFSNPALPPTEALTLLVTGKPPAGMNQSDANLVANAAVSLGISQSEWITSRLQQTFGVDVLALEAGDTYEDSSLVVGKQLTPRLYVSYAQNLFSPQSSFILQYQISRRLGLKAESGETDSIDIRYRIEH